MKLSARRLLFIDRFFALPHRLAELFFKTFTKISSSETDQVFVIKFMGWGSLVRLASLCEQQHVDKSKITIITFSQQARICNMFGFNQQLIIHTNSLRQFIKDCFHVLSISHKQRPSLIIDFERCSHAVSTFRLMMAWRAKCSVMSFELNRSVFTEKIEVHSVNEITQEKLFLLGIERMPKSKFNSEKSIVQIQSNKILININASDFLLARRYSIESFAEVIRSIYSQHLNHEFYFTGSIDESEYVDELISLLSDIPAYNKAGVWNFEQLVEELSSCAFFITGDSGPVHLAIYLGTPTIALWGPTQAYHFGYQNVKNLFSLSLNLPCSPCFKHPASHPAQFCNGQIQCLKNLNPDRIVNQALALIRDLPEERLITFPEKWNHTYHSNPVLQLEH